MSVQPEHADVGAYALGLLEPADREAFEEHLTTCDRCLDELADFSGMATLLTELRDEGVYELPEARGEPEPAGRAVPPQAAAPEPPALRVAPPTPPAPSTGSAPAAPSAPSAPSAPVDELAARRAARRAPRRSLLVAACAALVIGLGAGVLTGRTWFEDDSSTSTRAVPGDPMAVIAANGRVVGATGPNGGAAARIALESKAWGTNLALELRNVRGPLKCSLVAVDKAGKEQQISSWMVPPKGYGVPGSEAPLVLQTGTWTAKDDLARFDVRTSDGGTLVSVPA
ncbi:anti-sigma factor family protein [Embleya hyalina]|uniref:RNA polymerase subunit sigma n=1 Tax=Embleya hyalina TaxID=516124 RepID=A0A401YFY0_9ACTN|nr:zf-HC2 domain-containing protein [Embleya hyalina]GCD93470.1 RNA polymerase subunit sigma [Embleya hyalina]